VRAVRGADGVTVVEMAGLGRSESAKVPEELGDLAALVHEQAPTKTDENDETAESDESADDTTPDADPEQEPDAATPVPAAEGAQKK
jgi:cytochrome c biogenesis protein